MMKKLLLSTVSMGLIFAAQPTNQELVQKLNDLQKQLQELQAIIKKNNKKIKKNVKLIKKNKKKISKNKKHIKVNKNKVNAFASNDHLYWGFDLRTSYDVINKRTTGGYDSNGKKVDAKTYAGQVLSNRVILSAMYKPSDNLKANLKIEANKVFGMNSTTSNSDTNNDWVTNETPDDDTIRVKEAFFNYFFGPDNGLMFSAGRRPATEGFPANLREDDLANSPLSHSINMEFDGFSFRVGAPALAKLSDKFSDWGSSIKICAGRGASNVYGKFSNGQDYTKQNGADNSDLVGIFLVPYNDSQYAIQSSTAWVFNVAGYNKKTEQMQTVGNDFIQDITLSATGVGDGISDFLDDTTAFTSFAYSKTDPKDYKMLGSSDSKSGMSILIGADMPAYNDDRVGVSYAKGSKYWRSFTYGEDTLAGSMAAVRGNAYDVYYTHHIIPHLSTQIRYTYLDYKYPGSEAFFGDAGDPTATDSNYVKTAQDLRLYVRYRF